MEYSTGLLIVFPLILAFESWILVGMVLKVYQGRDVWLASSRKVQRNS